MERLRQFIPGILGVVAGAFFFVAGLSAFTFIQAEGHSYLSDDPEACVNCHVMREHFDAWSHSSHARVATCNDCHSPHDTLLNKYVAKGINGFNHSFAFTFGTHEQVFTITDYNRGIVNDSCIYCHENLVSEIPHQLDDSVECVSCHTGIGHPMRD